MPRELWGLLRALLYACGRLDEDEERLASGSCRVVRPTWNHQDRPPDARFFFFVTGLLLFDVDGMYPLLRCVSWVVRIL